MLTPLSCIICGNSDVTRLATAVGDRAYCAACFHGWRINRPDYAYSKIAMCALGTSPDRLIRQVRFFAPFTPPGAAILEIGCATGELAAATREMLHVDRYDAIELSPAGRIAKAHVDQLFDQPLRSSIDDGLIGSKFDVVVVSHVLEHLDDPEAELRAMKRVLGPGGAVFLEVPNGAGNRRLPIDDNRAHVHFFSITSLTRMLANSGFNVIAAATDIRLDSRYADSLQVIARLFQPPIWSRTLLSDHAALAGETAIVVWGAGSVAEEVLANFFDPAHIEFFVDRDRAKHGQSCMGRPILDPRALGHTPRTVLINSIDFAEDITIEIGRYFPLVPHRLIKIGDLLT